MAPPIGEFAAWCITGVAAILALIISQLESISKIVSEGGLRWGLVFLTSSMLLGAIVKQFGIALEKGLETIDSLYAELLTPEGKAMIEAIEMPPEELHNKIAEPFLWPLKGMMSRSAKQGAVDHIAGEKRYIRLLSLQIILSFLQSVTAVVGLLCMALSIK
jgi:hypothetical protein